MSEFPIAMEPVFVDRRRKRLPQDPAELAGTLLAAMMAQASRHQRSHSDKVIFIDTRMLTAFGRESFDVIGTVIDPIEPEDYVVSIGALESEHYAGNLLTHVPFETFGYSPDRAALGHIVGFPGFYSASVTLPGELQTTLDEAFNRAAELLSTRYHSQRAKTLGRYVARVAEAEQAVNRAESERRLAQAFQNRQSMAALMADDWLGLHVLYELANKEALTFSELVELADDNKDAMAIVVARLAASGMVETRGNTFACTQRGAEAVRNLESAVSSENSGAAAEST
jgi:hypothetical protein